jgi:hypothetical protein
MIPQIATRSKWLTRLVERVAEKATLLESSLIPLERPSLSQLARPGADLPRFVAESRLARKYLDLLGALDWDRFPPRDPHRAWPGPEPAPREPFVAAYLVKLDQNIRYMTRLREFLVDHPALVWILGFPLVPSDDYAWGFDADASLPSARQFSRVLRTLDNERLQFLLDATVTLLAGELPDDLHFGEAVAIDTKHIVAWVKENNLKVHVEDRYDKTRQPAADPDCRLGCKRRRNKKPSETGLKEDEPPTPTTDPVPARSLSVGEFYWGYGSGIAATQIPGWGEFVLAEFTQPFNRSDVSYFFPLVRDAERRLGFRPKYGALDAAYDAFYVYQYFHEAKGLAAVPFAERGGYTRSFDETGLPLCEAGLGMPLKLTFLCRTSLVEHEKGRYACPLLFPEASGEPCPIDHDDWHKGGCVTTMATCAGARIRYQLDRDGDLYKDIFRQRTATERINAQAVELDIERPKLRNGQSIANQNTLTYVLINLRALGRVRARKRAVARSS